MKTIISKISQDFINEAISSPRMLEDLASMEKYMSESYDGRTFIELLQNADVLNYCILMINMCGTDMDEIVREKIKRNNEKYPVEKAKDSAKKYDE